MKNLDQKTARALSTLCNTPEFRVFREYLAASLAKTDERLRSAEGTQMARYQGEAKTLEALIDKIDDAREIAEKHERNAL